MRRNRDDILRARVQPRSAAVIGIVLAVSILAVIAGLTILNLRNTSDRLDSVGQRTAVGEAYAAMNLAVAQAQVHTWYFTQTGDPAERARIVQSIRDIFAADAQVKAVGTNEDRAFISGLEARFGAQLSDGMRILAGSDPGTEAPNSLGNIAVLNEIAQALSAPASTSRAEASSELQGLQDGFNSSSGRILTAIVLGLPMLGLLSFALYRYEQDNAKEAAELKRLSQAALTDGLTGLANHRAFQEDLRREVMRGARTGRPLSFAIIDIDDFKEVNDSSGHARGDAVLTGLGKLMTYLRTEDRPYRVGGDEFALILPEEGLSSALQALDRLRQSVVDGLPGVTISIGVSSTENGVRHPTMLRDHADAALYMAKHRGKNQVVVYEPEMDRGTDITAAKMTAIRDVLHSGNVIMWFQPIFKLDTRQLLAFEALLRLPEFPDLAGPEEAFEIAQHMGRSLDLDMLCVKGALDTARTLPDDCKIFINLDPATLIHVDFDPDSLVRLVEERGIGRNKVVFELTEKTDVPLTMLTRQLDSLRERGFCVALDDVGTGNSGLEMLRVMKFDYVKIDRSVILDAINGGPGRAVVLAIVAFARESGAYMIAEGIENKAMLDTIQFDEDGLRKFWVQGVQGYLFGKPRRSVEGYLKESEQDNRAA